MLLFFAFGFFALLSQTLLLREISFLFTAHELSIACALAFWLFWTGAGITAVKKNSRLEIPGEDKSAGPVFAVFALAVPACMLAARQAARLAQTGLMPGFLEMIAGTLLLTMPAAFAGGLAASAGLRKRGVYFYAAETAGGALAGICALLYLRYFPSFSPLKAAVLCGAALTVSALFPERSKPLKTVSLCAGLALLAFFYFSDARSVFLKGGARPAEVFNSTGSRLTAASGAPGGTDLTENGTLLAALPDESGTYETFALPLLARAKPLKILAAGEKAFFAAPELLKYKPAVLEVAEPDRFRAQYLLSKPITAQVVTASGAKQSNKIAALPSVVRNGLSGRIAADFVPAATARTEQLRKPALKYGSLEVINKDARFLLASSTGGYSAIMLASGGPVNAAANRLYTLEFFRLAAKKLKPDGLLIFELPFSENYISPEQGYLASCLINTAHTAFENISLIPASRLTVIASAKPVNLDPPAMAEAYGKRRLKNRNAVPSAFPFLLDPNRARWAQAGLSKIKNPQVNSDLDPVSYFYFWRLWLSMVATPSMLLGLALTAIILVVSFIRLFGSAAVWREPAGASSLLIGFWGMAFEAGVILVFQTLTGQLAWKLGALFSAFLAGAASGSFPLKVFSSAPSSLIPQPSSLTPHPSEKHRLFGLALAEFMALGLSVLAAAVLKNSFAYGINAVFICSLFSLTAAGAISGVYFSCASAISPQKGPGVYARDLAGAALGAFAASAFAVPLWGLKSAFLLSAAAALLSLIIDGRHYLQNLAFRGHNS